MTTRRTFIKSLATAPSLFQFDAAWAATDSSRIALVIGNNAYSQSPLINPCNDARAVGQLFAQAGFGVDSLLDATRTDMMAAIERFGAAAKRPETRLVVFYYAGHGAQLDWRNYLLPVDAVVKTADHIKQRGVELNFLLAQLNAAKDKNFVVILDACRNNPFGNTYQLDQKGLSQFDAPVGSLLAYATSPGNVASDGSGENGLYTENLVRELSERSTRIEDALKRVRLNVRLASGGAQIPWETTSLESDVFIFKEGQKRLSEEELEKLMEADVAEWGRIKSSRKIDDWVGYMRRFPNGRMAEIAQVRLARLQQDTEKTRPVTSLVAEQAKPVAVAGPASKPEPIAAASAPKIDIREGANVPLLLAPSGNPFSAGSYRLNRQFTVGDAATFRQSDMLTGIETRVYAHNVTRVNIDEDRVEYNKGKFVTDLMGNLVRNMENEFDPPKQWVPAEFQLGKKWTALFRRKMAGVVFNVSHAMHIVSRETISVPAGSFDTFKIEGVGYREGKKLVFKIWLIPGLNFPVKLEEMNIGINGRINLAERHELVSLRQHAFDL